jgi:hypothetical protein
VYNRHMTSIILTYLAMVITISFLVIREDNLNKKIVDGFNPNAKDGDNDGIVQERTKWERKI